MFTKHSAPLFYQTIRANLARPALGIRPYSYSEILQRSEEVRTAQAVGRPLVALESTIITHGMPYPQNLEMAREVEGIIRENGAVPATIAILKGRITVGLEPDQLEALADVGKAIKPAVKTSRRDLPYVLAHGLDGGTTVSATIYAARMAGIEVFATGGIGGVHRMGQDSLDVSADLTELGRSRMCVVSSGVKSILDIPRTLEYLETQGVCVTTFGHTRDFPAFYTRKSGSLAPYHTQSAAAVANMIHVSREIGLNSGMLLAVPVPEQFAMDEAAINEAIESALADAKRQGVSGKEVTPFVLAAVAKVTGGASLKTNMALVANNAAVGARVAVELAKISSGLAKDNAATGSNMAEGRPLVVGGSNVDRTFRMKEGSVKLNGTTHAAKLQTSAGGVGRNIAEALYRLGSAPLFITALGRDPGGDLLRAGLPREIWGTGIDRPGVATASYTAVFDAEGECRLGLGDMDAHEEISVDMIKANMAAVENTPLIVIDGNVPQTTITYLLELAEKLDKPVFFEPTDIRKAIKTIRKKHKIAFATPNLHELRSMAKVLDESLEFKPTTVTSENSAIDEVLSLSQTVMNYVDNLFITLGSAGVLTLRKTDNPSYMSFKDQVITYNKPSDGNIQLKLYPVTMLTDIINVSGAGDCFASGLIHSLLLGKNETICMSVGLECAKSSLYSRNAVPDFFFNDNHECWFREAKFIVL